HVPVLHETARMSISFGSNPAPTTPRQVLQPEAPRSAVSMSAALGDLFFRYACSAAGLVVILLIALLTWFLIKDSWPSLRHFGLRFFTRAEWDPINNDYGALAFIFGTLVTSALAMLIAVPLSIGAAVFLAEIAPAWLRRVGSFLIELLAAIPSVIY